MLEQQRFRGDGADATRAEEFREGDKQVDRQEEQIAHESNVITPANLRKTTPQGPLGLEFRNSPPTGNVMLRPWLRALREGTDNRECVTLIHRPAYDGRLKAPGQNSTRTAGQF